MHVMKLGLREAIDAVRQPLAKARGLPNTTYTDVDLFAFERDAVLGTSWSAVCFASDLPAQNFALPIDFMGLPLLVLRDRNDELRVFHNVCRHRGMQLVREAAPIRNVLRCPYHSWSYTTDGSLVATPHVGGAGNADCPGFDKSGYGLVPVRFDTWMGIVFINLSGEAPPLHEYVRPLLDRWEAFVGHDGLEALEAATDDERVELTVDCNWKLAVENYCEAYHLPWVHPALNSYSPLADHYNIMIGDTMSGQGSLNYRLATALSEQLPRFVRWPAERVTHAEYISFYPNVLLGIQVDHAFAMIIDPLAVGRSRERLQISYVADGATADRYAACRSAVEQSWRAVFGEDVSAVEGMQNGRASPGFDGGVFTPVQDVPTHHFHSWVAGRYADALK